MIVGTLLSPDSPETVAKIIGSNPRARSMTELDISDDRIDWQSDIRRVDG